MRYFWYISDAKLDQLASNETSFMVRLRESLSALVKAELKTPVGSINIEMKSTADPKQINKVEKVCQKLASEDAIRTVEEIRDGEPALFFKFQGPTARLIQDGQFWVATADGESAVLLGGSVNHCFGSPKATGDVLSPSADPLASLRSLFGENTHVNNSSLPENLSYIWAMVVKNSLKLTSFESLPQTTGIAIYAGGQSSSKSQIRRSGYRGDISHVVVGSPIFVEQLG